MKAFNRHFAIVSIAVTASIAMAAAAETPDISDDPLTKAVAGAWEGTGEYEGNILSLTRNWTVELGGAFLRTDMRVTMPNGATFGALMYWKRQASGVYEVVWMDGVGRLQSLRATRDEKAGVVFSTFLDEFSGPAAEWRTWEFEPLGPDSYVERLYKHAGERRELLAEFRFERK